MNIHDIALSDLINEEEDCFLEKYKNIRFENNYDIDIEKKSEPGTEEDSFTTRFHHYLSKVSYFHKNQTRYTQFSTVPYVTHPLKVALIIYKATQNEDLTLAALFHDVVEDTDIRLFDVQELTKSEAITMYVYEVTKEELFSRHLPEFNMMTDTEKASFEIQKLHDISSFGKSLKLADIISNILSIQYKRDRGLRWMRRKKYQLKALMDSRTPELHKIAVDMLEHALPKEVY